MDLILQIFFTWTNCNSFFSLSRSYCFSYLEDRENLILYTFKWVKTNILPNCDYCCKNVFSSLGNMHLILISCWQGEKKKWQDRGGKGKMSISSMTMMILLLTSLSKWKKLQMWGYMAMLSQLLAFNFNLIQSLMIWELRSIKMCVLKKDIKYITATFNSLIL